MALLVGVDGAGWTANDVSFGSSGGEAYWVDAGYTPVSNGSATTAYVYVANWNTATQGKVLVYRKSDRVLLASSGNIAAAGGTGLRSASITYTTATTTDVILAFLPDTGYPTLRTQTGGSTYACYYDAVTAYATPDDPLAAGSNIPPAQFIIYLDGTVSGSGGGPLVGGNLVNGLLVGSLAK